MRTDRSAMPLVMPVLSPGKHRSPRTGACFMEMASYLAGERWSDSPRCTHALLAALARLVNDHTTDAGRGDLVPLIPSVIGLTSADARVDAWIALRCARIALPVACAGRQNALATSVLTADRVLAQLEGRPVGELRGDTAEALAQVPQAARWATQLTAGVDVSVRALQRHGAPAAVRCAVLGIADACVTDPDRLLHDLLGGAIADVRAVQPLVSAPRVAV